MSVLAIDNFQRPDENPLAGNWTAMANDPGNDWIPNQLISHQVFPTDVDLDAVSIYTGIVWPNDQWGQVVVGSTFTAGNGAEVGIELRSQGPGSEEDYECNVANQTDPAAPFQWFIYITTGGDTFAELASGFGTPGDNLVPGDTVYAQMVGSVITLSRNGIMLGSVSDSTYTTGSVGILESAVPAFGTNSSSISAFTGGGFGGGGGGGEGTANSGSPRNMKSLQQPLQSLNF